MIGDKQEGRARRRLVRPNHGRITRDVAVQMVAAMLSTLIVAIVKNALHMK